jgi:hypothetical protein
MRHAHAQRQCGAGAPDARWQIEAAEREQGIGQMVAGLIEDRNYIQHRMITPHAGAHRHKKAVEAQTTHGARYSDVPCV